MNANQDPYGGETAQSHETHLAPSGSVAEPTYLSQSALDTRYLASPALTGTPTAPTQATATDATTQVATDAFVQAAIVAATSTSMVTLTAALAGAAPSNAVGFNSDYILDTDSGHLWGPKTGGAWPGTAIVLPAAASSTGPGTLPTGAIVETVSRKLLNSNAVAAASGTLCGNLVHLQAGTVITSLSFQASGTGLSGGTHQWFGLLDTSGKVLAVSADDTSTAWASGTTKTLNLTSPLTIPTSGGYHLAFCVVATTTPTHHGIVASAPAISPFTSVTVAGQSGPPAVNSTLTFANAFNIYYGWAS